MGHHYSNSDYSEAHRRVKAVREFRQGTIHQHRVARREGNNLICRCGEVIGFVHDPRKAKP